MTTKPEDALVERLNDLRKRATAGPWGCTTRQGSWDWVVFCEADPNREICQPFHDGTEDNELGEANANLIALVPEMADAITTLLERERRLGEALTVADAALESVMNDEYDAFYMKVRAARDVARAALTGMGETRTPDSAEAAAGPSPR